MDNIITQDQAEQQGFRFTGDGIKTPSGVWITPELMAAWVASHACSECVRKFDSALVSAMDRQFGPGNAPPLHVITDEVRGFEVA